MQIIEANTPLHCKGVCSLDQSSSNWILKSQDVRGEEQLGNFFAFINFA